MDLQALIETAPFLYHMAEEGTWPKIKQHGLLSTEALLDRLNCPNALKVQILSSHRPKAVTVPDYPHPDFGQIVIRDQIPLNETRLAKCLIDDWTPRQWYETLNRRVFFWLRGSDLLKMLSAGAYRSRRHCVLTIDTAKLVASYSDRIRLSPINSGATPLKPARRGPETFRLIEEYPRRRIAELTVDYSVPDIACFVKVVEEMEARVITRVTSRSVYPEEEDRANVEEVERR